MFRDALFIAAVETKPRCTANHFFLEQPGAPLGIAKIEMVMRCSGVGGREVGEKCHGIYGCCVKKSKTYFCFFLQFSSFPFIFEGHRVLQACQTFSSVQLNLPFFFLRVEFFIEN